VREEARLFVARGTVVDNSDDMQGTTSWLIPLSILLITGITAADADECMTMRVSPRQALAPVNLRVSVRIEPNADNRVLTIVADSPEFYRSSQIQLEGDRAPKTVSIEYPNVPGGEYEITSVLVNSVGRERATIHQTARVVPLGGEP
jgi:hypothetical protein